MLSIILFVAVIAFIFLLVSDLIDLVSFSVSNYPLLFWIIFGTLLIFLMHFGSQTFMILKFIIYELFR